jgi:Flp pilus assembly protein TadG
MKRNRSTRRAGNVVVLTAVLMVALFAMVAFAIDVGYIVHARTELQRTADACALAAAAQLPDEYQATQAAQQRAADNYGTVGSDLDLQDIEFGYWDRKAATFTSPAPQYRNTNAVRVTLRRTHASGNPLRLFFAPMIGSDTADVTASATALYDRQLCGPLIGIEYVSVPGNPMTDSYDSSYGPYSAATAGDEGSLCSDGPIYIEGNPVVRGSARAGRGHQVIISGNPTVTGSIGTRLKPLNLPDVDDSEAAVYNDNDQVPLVRQGNSWISPVNEAGDFSLEAQRSVELPPGTYHFRNFSLHGQASVTITGPTVIYLTGSLHRAGGATVNTTTYPGDLQFLMTGGTATITAHNDFYGVVYGPNTDILLSDEFQETHCFALRQRPQLRES